MTVAQMETRDRLLSAARALFAARGFYGVSIAAIAQDVGLTKQALLHHFGNKETLYGEVLEGISARVTAAMNQAVAGTQDEDARLSHVLQALLGYMSEHEEDARIILRELLDNSERAARSRRWYLGDFLRALTNLALSHPRWAGKDEATARAAIYQMVGAVNYFAISGLTLTRIFGEDEAKKMQSAFPSELDRLIRGDQ